MVRKTLRRIPLVLVSAVSLFAGACAEYPSGSSSTTGTQLNITLTVAGQINPSDYYFVIFNNANNTTGTAGPEPVVAPPWGNGFCAGSATSYVEWTGSQAGDGYAVYSFQPGTNLQVHPQIAIPPQDTVPGTSSTLQFQIPLSFLATTAVHTSQINYIQINFIATNYIPVNPEDTSPKDFDALGDTLPGQGQLNDWISIPAQIAATYDNANSAVKEPEGDEERTNGGTGQYPFSPIVDPDVDLVNWSVQVVN